VDHAYEKILGRTKEKKATLVKKVLIIMVGARRPLTVREMSIALGMATSTVSGPLAQRKLDPDRLEDAIRHLSNLFVVMRH